MWDAGWLMVTDIMPLLSVLILQIGLLCLCQSPTANGQQLVLEPAKYQTSTAPTPPTTTTSHGPESGQDEQQDVYLESMEDIEHVTYLSLRNFNMTDEGLLQSSWLLSSANTIVHKQHQKIALSATLSAASGGTDLKERLALMLESFTSHLRNGHLSRLSLNELRAIVANLNQSELAARESDAFVGLDVDYAARESEEIIETGSGSNDTTKPSLQTALIESRCQLLVAIYKFELSERHKSGQQQQQSKVEYENAPLQQLAANPQVSSKRLMRLCRLAVKCHSADELVNLLSGPWRDDPARAERPVASESPSGTSRLESEFAESEEAEPGKPDAPRPAKSSKSLRDSMSLSLAKLCPLILFQLHDDEGLCSIRRDDRPPMITVWAFATLFVTIVSFCSLIGLSITPLLGPTNSAVSSSSSETSDEPHPITPTVRRHSRTGMPSAVLYQQQQVNNHQQHRACLTLFEGLAVGSLVGSALFSLIPQAFELQERESNQGFLLKALIIFFGIYLFFCSERLMRIILDTRQQRKKNKRLNHRSSNSIPLPSTTVDFDHNQQQQEQHLLALHNHSARQDRLKAMRMSESTKNGRKNLSSQQMAVDTSDQSVAVVKLSPKSLRAKQKQQTSSRLAGKASQLKTDKKTSGKQCNKVTEEEEEDEQVDAVDDQHIKIGADRVVPPSDGEIATSARPSASSSATRSVSFPRKQRSLDESGQRVKSSEIKLKSGARKQQVEQDDLSARNLGSCLPAPAPTSMKSLNATSSGSRNRVRRRKTRHQLLAAKRERRKRLELQQQLFRTDFDGKPLAQDNQRQGGRQTVFASLLKPAPSEVQDQIRQCYPFSDSSSDESCHSEASCDQERMATSKHMSALRYSGNQKPSPLPANEPFYAEHQANYLREPSRDPFLQTHRASNEACLHPLADSYSSKQDISTVAWMIVLGDGLHNFIDGISIGAAFSESILSGVSISVAVICEEFPHELGDFAVLVSSGMTVRQALGYNFLSACTCYLGMAVGIILGDVNDGASYISALAAGVFLYIALVDMMGELSATLEESSRDSIAKTLKLLLLQNVGIFIGISIIFVLSFIDF